ncbi:MAG TPA: 2-C-methyl-D-erythritol 2,4-cyclodiphosphate synthase [Bacteroidia bacterium]|nr:2-C-methyl-D-erythritol 2,4-cyclodiphosphate synthase [Bacteroidia bacterium]HNT79282.1 2-C-methyl-D-erythritol 2,4-cyclodiphosphate synthase [Bacteroidia bacterium]
MNFRIGYGFDVHQLVEDRPLIIGGIHIPYSLGALGHSDADVLLHAICDALLGAAALGDIGQHFPDTSNEFKNIDSKILLARVSELLQTHQYKISNIDATLILEKPKIAPYIDQMRSTISSILHLETDQISIKATTNEKLGYVGAQQGVEASAVALIFK